MKIFILDPIQPAGVEYAAKHFDTVRWDDPRVSQWPEEADALIVRMTPVRAADIARAKKVRIISKQGVGYDTVDIEAAKKCGIVVCRTPGVNSDAVAEIALALGRATIDIVDMGLYPSSGSHGTVALWIRGGVVAEQAERLVRDLGLEVARSD